MTDKNTNQCYSFFFNFILIINYKKTPQCFSVPSVATSVLSSSTSEPSVATSVLLSGTPVPSVATSVLLSSTSVSPVATLVLLSNTSVPSVAISVLLSRSSVLLSSTSVLFWNLSSFGFSSDSENYAYIGYVQDICICFGLFTLYT